MVEELIAKIVQQEKKQALEQFRQEDFSRLVQKGLREISRPRQAQPWRRLSLIAGGMFALVFMALVFFWPFRAIYRSNGPQRLARLLQQTPFFQDASFAEKKSSTVLQRSPWVDLLETQIGRNWQSRSPETQSDNKYLAKAGVNGEKVEEKLGALIKERTIERALELYWQ